MRRVSKLRRLPNGFGEGQYAVLIKLLHTSRLAGWRWPGQCAEMSGCSPTSAGIHQQRGDTANCGDIGQQNHPVNTVIDIFLRNMVRARFVSSHGDFPLNDTRSHCTAIFHCNTVNRDFVQPRETKEIGPFSD